MLPKFLVLEVAFSMEVELELSVGSLHSWELPVHFYQLISALGHFSAQQ
jgi:hypothetical protein